MFLLLPFFSSLFFVDFFVVRSGAILAGESVDWLRNGFLVKVLARNGPDSDVRSCTGSMVTASLVLTSAYCVMDETTAKKRKWKSFREFVVLAPVPAGGDSNETEFRSTAKLVFTSSIATAAEQQQHPIGGWALLRVAPRNVTELCPPSPAPKWISRLNFLPTLANASRFNVDESQLADNKRVDCYMLGFSSTEKAEDFLEERDVLRLFLANVDGPLPNEKTGHFRSHISAVHGNFTPCYEDMGAPLLCKLNSLGFVFQLGLFQTLKMEARKGEEKGGEQQAVVEGTERCRQASEMRFTLFANDDELLGAIQKFAMPEFVAAYQKCEFDKL